jgi:hypothetical protein
VTEPDDKAEAFIAKWTGNAASEFSTSQSFLLDLCELLCVDKPHPTADQAYMFERPITFRHGDGSTSAGRIDLYRRGCDAAGRPLAFRNESVSGGFVATYADTGEPYPDEHACWIDGIACRAGEHYWGGIVVQRAT